MNSEVISKTQLLLVPLLDLDERKVVLLVWCGWCWAGAAAAAKTAAAHNGNGPTCCSAATTVQYYTIQYCCSPCPLCVAGSTHSSTVLLYVVQQYVVRRTILILRTAEYGVFRRHEWSLSPLFSLFFVAAVLLCVFSPRSSPVW